MWSSFVSKLALVFALLLTFPVEVEAHTPTWKQNLETALSGEAAGHVLAFEHDSSTWHGLAWSGTSLSDLDEDVFDIGFDSKAELQVGDRETLYVYLVDTNPLLYTLDPTEATEADSENAASLNQFVELLSTVLQRRVTFLGEAAAEVSEAISDAEAPAEAVEGVQLSSSAQQPSSYRQEDDSIDPSKVKGLAEDLEKALQPSPTRLFETVVDLEISLESLHSLVTALMAHEALLASLAQQVEIGEIEGDIQFGGLPSPAQLDALLFEIAGARIALHELNVICVGPLAQLQQLVELSREPVAKDKLAATRQDFEDQRSDLQLPADEVALALACGRHDDAEKRRTLAETITSIATQLPAPAEKGNLGLGLRENLLGVLQPYNAAIEKRTELLAAAKTVGDGAGALVRSIAKQHLLQRKADADGNGTIEAAEAKRLVNGVVAYRRPQGTIAKVKSGKVRTEGFTVKADERFKEMVVLDHPVDVKAEYELHHEIRGIDFDFGLVYTDLAVAEFGAVSSTVDDTPGCDGIDDCKIIAQTGEDTRSGNVALFATFRLDDGDDSGPRYGWQLGAGVDTDEPALFAGFGYGIKSMKISAGYTYQEITVLDEPSQSLGDIVASGDDIKTRSDWDGSWYLAVSITLNDLSFFAPDDDE